jgi:hypothetical protein
MRLPWSARVSILTKIREYGYFHRLNVLQYGIAGHKVIMQLETIRDFAQ